MCSSPDVELGLPRDGYPALASWIAEDPDHSTFIFRKFSRLSARNLLHLQAQVYELEKQLDDLDRETTLSQNVILKMSARRWETFAEHAKKPGAVRRRMEVANQIAIRLKEYRPSRPCPVFDVRFDNLLIDCRRSSDSSGQHRVSRKSG